MTKKIWEQCFCAIFARRNMSAAWRIQESQYETINSFTKTNHYYMYFYFLLAKTD